MLTEHNEYLCQFQQDDGTTVELPIRFLSETFSGAQMVNHWEGSARHTLVVKEIWWLWVGFASPYERIIVIYFTSIIMAHEKFSSGSWIFSITMPLSNMSRELNIPADVSAVWSQKHQWSLWTKLWFYSVQMHNVSSLRKAMSGTMSITVSTGRSYSWHNAIHSRRPQTIGHIYDMMYALTYKVALHTKRCQGATKS